MATLLYIHGFLSSPLSIKAQQVDHWLQANNPQTHYECPLLTPYPNEVAKVLTDIVEKNQGDVYLMGSSMGGFWSTWLSEKYDLPAVLINPAVNVMELMPKYLNQTLTNYHTDHTYRLSEEHLEQLATFQVGSIKHPQNYWVLLQTGDETLDYRLAVEKYQACRQTVEAGGDHGFQNFERFIPESFNFYSAHQKSST